MIGRAFGKDRGAAAMRPTFGKDRGGGCHAADIRQRSRGRLPRGSRPQRGARRRRIASAARVNFVHSNKKSVCVLVFQCVKRLVLQIQQRRIDDLGVQPLKFCVHDKEPHSETK